MNTIIISLIIFIVVISFLEILLVINRIRTRRFYQGSSRKRTTKKRSEENGKHNAIFAEMADEEIRRLSYREQNIEIVDLSDSDLEEDNGDHEVFNNVKIEAEEQNHIPVVIEAQHICLDFYKEVNEYTSLKELVIKSIKRQRDKGVYRALDDISFTVKKGEVLGIIGTNGAGKSTLLKVVAGALYPTSGTMIVDKSKVQILTLGTGFDMEMTGKENVYLNGSIIGYDRQFIDEHYNQIVEFAELQDFMDERVKNYSSGMVSRLGFAIATAGNAAEILILDEVLSVGDRIFREKSLKRVKEMIHGGSTVIMVSHSTATIKENCDRALWIEKGHFIEIGSAMEVCNHYEKYDGNLEVLLAT